MAEEEEFNKPKKFSVKSIGDAWIVCRSQSHEGRIYYFNTETGNAVWNLGEAEKKKAKLHTMAIAGQPGTSIRDCPEPTEPPGDTHDCGSHHHDAQKVKGPRIYNKQIINNQFTKPYAVSPFANPQCHCGSLSPMNDVSVNVVSAPVYNPNIWAIPPPHHVFLAPTLSALTNQAQPSEDLNPPLRNGAVPLSSRFQIVNQLVNNSDSHSQGIHKCRPRYTNFHVKRPQSLYTRNFQNKMNNDLRDVLSSKRKDFVREDNETDFQETHKDLGNHSEITDGDLYPSDIDDEWLKANATGEDKNLSLDISSLWSLAGESAKTNCWFIIASTGVLLNHISFLSSLINSDERVRLLTPTEVVRRLRAATGSGACAARLSQRARRANRLAALQLHKIPAALKNLQKGTITSCCLELIEQNYHVVLLMNDDDELESQNVTESVRKFTIKGLKEHIRRNSYVPKTNCRDNITTMVLSSNDANNECFLKSNTLLCQSTTFNSREIEIQTDLKVAPGKQTVNASVQTDFDIKPAMSPNSTSDNVDSNSLVNTLEIDHTLKNNTVIESSNESKELKVGPKKIKLNRNRPATLAKPVEKPTIKWRKRKVNTAQTNPMTLTVDADLNEHTQQENSSSILSTDDLILHQIDNAVDYEDNTEISNENLPRVDEKVTSEESSTLSVISNSVDSESMFKVDKKTILNQSKENEMEDIVMFEVAGDQMVEYLTMRRDEWVSRFVQIMEEALSQILQLEPYFVDSTIPPPWSILEATVCIKRKFMNNKKVVFAANKLAVVLQQLSDSRGKIYAELNPSDFMKLYSYGVYLLNALQDVLMDSEDLQIARTSLSKLLEDIRDPNLDILHNVFIDDDKVEKPVNRTGEVTNVENNIVPASTETTEDEDIQDTPVSSNKSSPSKYNLRSNKQQKKDGEVKIIRTINDDDSFFASLRLQKNTSSQVGTLKSSHSLHTNKQEANEEGNELDKIEPKIIRNFNICPKMEETLKNKKAELIDKYFAEDNISTGNEFYLDEKMYTSEVVEERYSRSSLSEDRDTTTVLKWLMHRTTFPIHRVLVAVHTFCNETYVELYTKEKLERNYKTKLFEKTTEVYAHMEILCKYLNRILHRKNTESKFRCMMKELGCDDVAVCSSQVEEYVAHVKRYIGQASLLLDSVNLIAAAIKEKEIIRTMEA